MSSWKVCLFCFTNPSRLICYVLNKYYENNTHSPSSGKSLALLTWFQFCLYSLLLGLFFSFLFFNFTSRSDLLIEFFSCRSIWTCASHQSSIPPASLTPAAPAPLVTTLCFPMTHYQMSPASPSTSTSMATSKHELPPTAVWKNSPVLPTHKNTHSKGTLTPLLTSSPILSLLWLQMD